MLDEIKYNMAVGSIVNYSDKFTIIFLEGPLAGDIASAIERLEENGYTLIHGIQHTVILTRPLGRNDLYSATLRKS